MNQHETEFRAIKDRIANALGRLDEDAVNPERKQNYQRLLRTAAELHRCADDMQNILMRLKPR